MARNIGRVLHFGIPAAHTPGALEPYCAQGAERVARGGIAPVTPDTKQVECKHCLARMGA